LAAAAVFSAGASWAQQAAVPQPAPLAIKPAVPYVARPLPLADVRLTGGPLKAAQELDAQYLLSLEPDKILYGLRVHAGLQPKADGGYGGWDNPEGRQLSGHIAGHYLSAISYMYAATGNPEFKRRVDYMVGEMAECQAAEKDGYLGALKGNAPNPGRGRGGAAAGGATTAPAAAGGGAGRGRGPQPVMDGKELFKQVAQGQIRSTGFDLNGMWSPWYVQHKIYAGLRDAYRVAGNKQALDVETKFAAWAESIVGGLSEQQLQGYNETTPEGRQRHVPGMLDTEFGGMNEVLADLYADTGDKRWYELSARFEHKSLVEPLAKGEDVLPRKHGNTQVPKLLGDLMRWVYGGDETAGKAARFFWDEVALHHSFATGGHGRNEYFGDPDKLVPMLEGRTAESCNVYNMLKFSRELFALQPDIKYADFHERALFNHVLASINPRNAGLAYMVPVGQGVRQEYGGNDGFTCCVGTGMESHALHGYGLYYEAGERLYVNLFAPSTANWRAQGVTIEQETAFPEGETASLKIAPATPKELTVSIRRPSWAGDGFAVTVNGEPVKDLGKPDSYVDIKRTWKAGDTVAVTLPKKLWKAATPDDPTKTALMWGPLVLAADMSGMPTPGRGGRGNRGGAGAQPAAAPVYPVFVSDAPIEEWLLPVEGQPAGTFRAVGRAPATGAEAPVIFRPFYRTHNIAYGIYWDVLTTADWQKRSAQLAADQARQQRLQAATVAVVQPGLMQMERDFNFRASDESTVVTVGERSGRRAAGWMAFDLPVDEAHPMALVVTYRNDEPAARRFEVQVDGTKVKEELVERGSPQEFNFVEREYAVPAELVKGKQKVTVRFQAAEGSEVGRVFGLRMLRADMR
jgi:DUF1680 family protein